MNSLIVSKHPVSQLVAQLIANSSMKDSAFVRSLGYQNVNKGLRRLNGLLRGCVPNDSFLQRIQEVYGHRDEIEQVFVEIARVERERREAETREWESSAPERERLAREGFTPYVRVLTAQQRPNSISMFSIACSMFRKDERYIHLPASFLTLPEADGLTKVQDIVRQHYTNKSPDPGHTCFFGAITGYVYVHHYGQSTRLAVDGTVLTMESEDSQPGFASLTVGNKTIVTHGQRSEIDISTKSER